MSLLLDQPDQPKVYRLSVNAYHQLGELGLIGEDVELLRGIIIQKMSKSPLHDLVLRYIARQLNRMVSETYDVRVESPLTIGNSEPEPDISIVEWCPEQRREGHAETALLVVEVSITTLGADKEKIGIYAEAGIPDYWLVRPENRTVDVFHEPSPDGYRTRTTLRDGDMLRLGSLPGVEIPVSDIFPPRD